MKELKLSSPVMDAIRDGKPVVALESTVIAHGLPYPENLESARACEDEVIQRGAIPATIAVFNGQPHVGLSGVQLEQLATGKDFRKISRRELPVAIAKKLNCATTV